MKKISEVSKEFRISVRTLHYYDNIGLLVPEKRNQIRLYSTEDENALRIILFYKESGLSLTEIKNLLASNDFSMMNQRRDELIAKRNRINEMIMYIDQISALKRHPSSIEEITNPFGASIRQLAGDEQTNKVYQSLYNMESYSQKLSDIFAKFQLVKEDKNELQRLMLSYYAYFVEDLHLSISPSSFMETVKQGLKTSNFLNHEDTEIFCKALEEFAL
ncbi:MAG: MerR family transcriptional regulator [Erysipelotrichaceae bacterium]